MATFTININAQVVAPYQAHGNSLSKGVNCSGFIFENTATIAEETPTFPSLRLLSPWMMSTAGLVLKTLHIREILYSDDTMLWYEYNGIKLDPIIDHAIDITGLDYQDIIPTFKIKGAQLPNDITTQTVSCKIALEDTDNIKYEYRNNTMTVYYSECV
jgi:hypothetical protein